MARALPRIVSADNSRQRAGQSSAEQSGALRGRKARQSGDRPRIRVALPGSSISFWVRRCRRVSMPATPTIAAMLISWIASILCRRCFLEPSGSRYPSNSAVPTRPRMTRVASSIHRRPATDSPRASSFSSPSASTRPSPSVQDCIVRRFFDNGPPEVRSKRRRRSRKARIAHGSYQTRNLLRLHLTLVLYQYRAY